MESAINYWWAVPVLIGLLLLLFWMIRRNLKDEKKYEKDFIRSELKPREHNPNDDAGAN